MLAADAVSLIGAILLYFLATSDVKGFAFFLGLSTLLDVLIITYFFTRPLVAILGRNERVTEAKVIGISRGLAVQGGGQTVSAARRSRGRGSGGDLSAARKNVEPLRPSGSGDPEAPTVAGDVEETQGVEEALPEEVLAEGELAHDEAQEVAAEKPAEDGVSSGEHDEQAFEDEPVDDRSMTTRSSTKRAGRRRRIRR